VFENWRHVAILLGFDCFGCVGDPFDTGEDCAILDLELLEPSCRRRRPAFRRRQICAVVIVEHETDLRHLGDVCGDNRIRVGIVERSAAINRREFAGGD